MYSLRHSFSVFLVLILIIAVNCLEGLYYFYQQPGYPRDCKEVYEHCPANNSSGVYTIRPDGYPEPFEVYCNNELSPSGWTVIKRQLDGSLTLTRTWEDYKKGFGFLSGEFYIGNEKLSYLTNQGVYELRIDIMLSNGSYFYIRYNKFRISDEFSQYELVNAEGFSGNSSCVATSCPVAMVHESCTCQTSCSDSVGQPDCRELCVETCVPKRCFITETNSILRDDDTYVNSGCTRRCTCSNNRLDCDDSYRCSPNAACREENDVRQCYCNPGYSGDGTNCTSICSTNEVWGTCSCQKSCANPTSCVSCSGEKCYCPNGFYLQEGNCVRQEQCGCYIDGNILHDGDTYVNSDCTRRCTCNNKRLNCDNNYRCSSDAACSVRNSVRQCYCNSGYGGDGRTCRRLTDCNDVQNAGNTQSGVYSIRPTGWTGSPFDVFCNMTIDGGGWTVFQRRINGVTNFYRNWISYKNGFGNIQQEFWLGNEKLYYLTQQATYEYRLDFVTSSYSSLYDKYSRFRIGNEANKYKVTDLGSQSGSGYSLHYLQNIAFSTYDRDNDGKSSTDCADGHRSGWWHGGSYNDYSSSRCHLFPEGSRYRFCSVANLNGEYSGSNGKNIFTYRYNYCQLEYTEMKIRRTS